MKNLKVEITEEFSTVKGYTRVSVSWREGRTLHTETSNVFSDDTPPELVAESLRSLGWRILKRCNRL